MRLATKLIAGSLLIALVLVLVGATGYYYLAGLDMVIDQLGEGAAGIIDIEEIRYLFLAWSIVIVALAFIVGFLVAHSISKPLRQITEVAEEINRGNMDVGPLAITTEDEIGELARAFNRLIAAVKFLHREEDRKKTAEQEERAK